MIHFRNTLLILFSFMLLSCGKDKLTDDYKPLVGKWRLAKSTDQHTGQVTYPSGDAQVVEFLEKGKYFIYKNGKKTGKGYITISDDHLEFRATGMEMAKNEMTFKSLQPGNLHNDSLYLPDHAHAGYQGKDEIYVRE